MTGLERYRRVLDGQAADIVPRIPIVMQLAAEHIGSDYAAFASDYRVLVQANEACVRDFGFDQVSCISDPYRETHGFGGVITYVKDGPPHSTHPLQESRDLARLQQPDPFRSERMLDRVRAVESYRQRAAGSWSILGWVEGPAAEAADLRDVTNLLLDLMDDAAFAGALMDRCLAVGNPFMVNAGCEIPSGTPAANLLALCEPLPYCA